MQKYAGICSYMQIYADICRFMQLYTVMCAVIISYKQLCEIKRKQRAMHYADYSHVSSCFNFAHKNYSPESDQEPESGFN